MIRYLNPYERGCNILRSKSCRMYDITESYDDLDLIEEPYLREEVVYVDVHVTNPDGEDLADIKSVEERTGAAWMGSGWLI